MFHSSFRPNIELKYNKILFLPLKNQKLESYNSKCKIVSIKKNFISLKAMIELIC